MEDDPLSYDGSYSTSGKSLLIFDHKINSMKKFFPTFICFIVLNTTLIAQNNVALFEECNYSGKRAYLTPGNYKLYQMQIGNDDLSSMQIPNGLKVTIY